jgi:hypothetical protein
VRDEYAVQLVELEAGVGEALNEPRPQSIW